jgi:hypothetical protein
MLENWSYGIMEFRFQYSIIPNEMIKRYQLCLAQYEVYG